MRRIQLLMNNMAEWSQNTFNKGVYCPIRTISMAHHLLEEVKELIESVKLCHKHIGSLELQNKMNEEFADCFILLFNCATNENLSIEHIYNLCREKLEINKQRSWGKPDKDGVVKHIKDDG